MSRVMIGAVLMAGIMSLAGGPNAYGNSCSGGIVSPGDSKPEVLMKCGEPTSKQSHDEEITTRTDDTRRKEIVNVEEWVYNPGPTSFIRILEFRNGKLADIRTGGYGYSETKGRAANCEDVKIERDTTTFDVVARCGDPTWKDSHNEEITEEVAEGVKRKVIVTVEEWTYNLGPNKFMRVLTFRNGKLVDVKTGNYGQ